MARSEHPPARKYAAGFSMAGAVDMTDLIQLADNDTFAAGSSGFLQEIVELFLQLTPRLYETAEAALEDGDGASLARAAHKLESQAAYFGARRLVRVCRQLEDFGLAQDLKRAQVALPDLEDELDRVRAALLPYRSEHPPGW